ncbi:MAG TPA: sigma factor-like helix-turn-helix DNA-binding protein [Steroidobacteraceae bacterium]|nr:sigma factor-like helix-turn-helix DNA-binding protein [Steroidobacteraceae bacterium]
MQDETVARALSFDAELRTWLAACRLDAHQTQECLDTVNVSLLTQNTGHLRGKRLRLQVFAYAREAVLQLLGAAPGSDRAALSESLPWVARFSPPALRQPNGRAAQVRLLSVVQQLPERCRQVFTLYKVYELTPAQVAQRLSISEEDVVHELKAAALACAAAEFSVPDSIGTARTHTVADRNTRTDHEPVGLRALLN